ncbi:MAG: 50S ribosomal protein L25 [Gemmatimonadales bacterium]|nr:50S ribosomal protein L25 [Gemmatimonadales bacterium]
MAHDATLSADPRTGTGKGVARSLRRTGRIPAVIYGHGREPEALSLDSTALTRLLTGISAESTVLNVEVAGRPAVRALIREIQRSPIKPSDILHVDLFEVQADEEIEVDVPVRLIGIPEGVRVGGGTLDHVMHALTISVLPGDLPASIDLDVSGLTIGHGIHVRDITVPNATILNDEDLPVASVIPPRTEAAPAVEADASAEPELIRKAKAEDEDAD